MYIILDSCLARRSLYLSLAEFQFDLDPSLLVLLTSGQDFKMEDTVEKIFSQLVVSTFYTPCLC